MSFLMYSYIELKEFLHFQVLGKLTDKVLMKKLWSFHSFTGLRQMKQIKEADLILGVKLAFWQLFDGS